DVLFDDLTEDRHLQQERVPADSPVAEFADQLDGQHEADRYDRNQVPIVDRGVTHVHQQHGHGRQLQTEAVEDLDELGHDLVHDEDQDAHGHGDHDHRVDERAFDLALQGLGFLLELGQAAENDFQGTAGLASLDHVHIQPVEG